MNYETYNKLISYLDIIEGELNKVAKIVGSCSVEEFITEKENSEQRKAA